MKIARLVTIGCLIGALFALSCKSVDTTSAILRNQEGNYDQALTLCRKALASNPNDAEAHFQMGFAYSNLDSVGLAYKHFMKAKELDPKKSEMVADNIQSNYAKHYKLGQSAFNRDDFAVASTEFGMATESDPMQATAHFNLAVSYARLAAKDPVYREKALASADRVLELSNPSEANYSKALQLAGRQLVELGREEEAVNRFKRLVEEDPSNYQVIQDIGMDLLNTEKWKGAAIFLEMTADARQKVGAEDFDVYYNVGLAHYKMRAQDPAEIDEAIAWYERALTVRPDEPTAVFNIEVAYVAKQDWTNAGTWGEKYITLQPSDPQGWQLLARIYSELGEKEKANEALQRYQQLQG